MDQASPPQDGLAARARAVTMQLVSWPSVTGSEGEAAFAGRLAGLLSEHPYFRAHPEHLALRPIDGEPQGRANLFALVRGKGARTVVLAGHFDVAPVEDYGELAGLAWHPEPLAKALVERLRRTGADSQALADLESGEFLPGRGILDMKSGVAAGVAVLEAFAADPAREGNLLLIATPDEENQSAGMRAAVPELPAFLAAQGLEPLLALNLDAILDNGDGSAGQVMAEGCIGKLLLCALVVGREAHACYSLEGVNAAYLAAELVSAFEFAPELGEETGAELANPPAVLGLADLKPAYNVTLPGRAFVFWNVLMHRRTAEEVFRLARGIAGEAMARAAARIAERAARLSNPPDRAPEWGHIPVLTYAEVQAAARKRDPGFAARLAEEARRLVAEGLDAPAMTRRLASSAFDASGLEGPAVVLAVGGMPYPAVRLVEGREDERLAAILAREAEDASRRHATPVSSIAYFPAIADMSFLGRFPLDDMRFVAANAPLWGTAIDWDTGSEAFRGLPVVNIGPWGRDYHQALERVHARYAFEVLPDLIARVCRAVLKG